MTARIYQPAKTATSSGRAKTRYWLLEMEPEDRKTIDPLCGWSGSGDTAQQIQLRFPTKEAALAYARKNGIQARVSAPKAQHILPKSYASNFIRSA